MCAKQTLPQCNNKKMSCKTIWKKKRTKNEILRMPTAVHPNDNKGLLKTLRLYRTNSIIIFIYIAVIITVIILIVNIIMCPF